MEHKIYVIRKIAYLWNGDYYHSVGSGAIAGHYTDKVQAKQAFEQLEIAAIRASDFSTIEQMNSIKYRGVSNKIDEYLQTILPESIFIRSERGFIWARYKTYLPETLTDEQILQLREIGNIQFYELNVFEKKAVFYGIWLVARSEFIQLQRSSTGDRAVYFFNSYQEALDGLARFLEIFDEIKLKGEIEDLTDQPILLQSLIESTSGISYGYGVLYLRPAVTQQNLVALNKLLKKPLFEIRPLSLEEVEHFPHELFEVPTGWKPLYLDMP